MPTTPQQLTFFEVTGHFYAVANPSISGVLNSPVIEPINALVTFAPRIPKGQMFYVDEYLVTAAYNNLQVVNFIGNPEGGTYKLQFGADWTEPPLAFDAPYATIQAALEALPGIGVGNVHVEGDISPQAFQVEFLNALGDQEVVPLVGDATQLSNELGPGNCDITVTTTDLGSPEIIADTAVALPPLTARIMGGELSTIDYVDTPGIQLTANSEALNFVAEETLCKCPQELVYDVSFSLVTFNGKDQVLAPFAFVAPHDDTPIVLTDPLLERLPYAPVGSTTWVPTTRPQAGPAVQLVPLGARGDWRTRADARVG